MAKSLREKKINQIMYVSLGGVITAIILFIVLFNIFSNKSKDDKINTQIGEGIMPEQIDIEETNSAIGKSVEESVAAEEYENIENVAELQEHSAMDTTQIQGDLGIQLSEQEDLSVNENDNDVASSSKQDAENDINVENNTDNSSIEDNPVVNNEEPDPTFSMPVDGEIIKHYGKEKLIYSDTLKEWTTHLGIDIKANKTTIVKSSADGVVKSIKNDPRYGLTIVVEHQNGFTSVYANLLTAEFVVIGENVKAGQTLGTVGNSATFEILDDPHLHFEILKDGEYVDPEMYVKLQ